MRQQAGIVEIDAESDHVDFSFAPLAAELHTRYETDRVGGACRASQFAARNRIVIGQSQ